MERDFLGPQPICRDLALLAFVKCHLTSVTRWNALRALAASDEGWADAGRIARAIHQSTDAAREALDGLAREQLIRRRRGLGGVVYRLDPADPTSRVVARLVDAAVHDPELRRIIAARVVAPDLLPTYAAPLATASVPATSRTVARAIA